MAIKKTPPQPDPSSTDQPSQSEGKPQEQAGVHVPETTPAQERGERIDTGKAIARGGKEEGHVPGAEPAQGSRQ